MRTNWIAGILLFVVVGAAIWIWHNLVYVPRRRREAAEERRQAIKGIFDAIITEFSRYGLTFKLAIDCHGNIGGSTEPLRSGVYMNITPFFPGGFDYTVDFSYDLRGNPESALEECARRFLYDEIKFVLFQGAVVHCQFFFFRQNLFRLKEIGLEEVVALWATTLLRHEHVWRELERDGMPAQIMTIMARRDLELEAMKGRAQDAVRGYATTYKPPE